MDLRHIEHFLGVYRYRSELHAARKLNVAQSTLSTTLRALELEFGVKLFERTAYGLVPTPSARHLHRMCEPVLRNAIFACRYIASRSKLLPTDLSIRAPVNVPGGLLCEAIEHALDEAGKQHPYIRPSVDYEVSVDGSTSPLDAPADVTIAYRPVNRDADAPETPAEALAYESWVAVTASRADLAPPGPIPLSLLRGLAIITPPVPRHLRRDLSARFRRSRIQPGSIGVANVEAIHAELLSGRAQIALLPMTALHAGLRNAQFRLYPMAQGDAPARIVMYAGELAAQADFVRSFSQALRIALRAGLDRISTELAPAKGVE